MQMPEAILNARSEKIHYSKKDPELINENPVTLNIPG